MNGTMQARNELLEKVAVLTDEQLNQRASDDKWTVMQVLEHLYLMESAIVNNMSKALNSAENNPTDRKPFQLTLDRSRKIAAPAGLVPANRFQTLEEAKGKLGSSRKALTDLITGISEHDLEQKSFPHPVFGLMDAKQWVDFIGVHEKRHLAQIEELEQELFKKWLS
jgi:hypothetical protein